MKQRFKQFNIATAFPASGQLRMHTECPFITMEKIFFCGQNRLQLEFACAILKKRLIRQSWAYAGEPDNTRCASGE